MSGKMTKFEVKFTLKFQSEIPAEVIQRRLEGRASAFLSGLIEYGPENLVYHRETVSRIKAMCFGSVIQRGGGFFLRFQEFPCSDDTDECITTTYTFHHWETRHLIRITGGGEITGLPLRTAVEELESYEEALAGGKCIHWDSTLSMLRAISEGVEDSYKPNLLKRLPKFPKHIEWVMTNDRNPTNTEQND